MPSNKRKTIKAPTTSLWSQRQSMVITGIFGIAVCCLLVLISYLLYLSYQSHRDPQKLYGEWIEIGAPPYKTERLTFAPNGVYRNYRLVATTFEFDGKVISLETGLGKTAYQISGSHLSPQLRRVDPLIPDQRFIRKGFEHTVKGSEIGSTSKRRAALSEHFNHD